MNLDPHWLRDRYKHYDDDSLQACLDQVKAFGGDPADIRMMEMECKRRSEERELSQPML
jgi:hypothetical protein